MMYLPKPERLRRYCVGGILGVLLIAASGCSYEKAQPPDPDNLPETRVEVVTDTLHGTEISDPYRWLEDQESAETRAWIERQNAYTDRVLAGYPDEQKLRAQIEPFFKIESVGTPAARGGRYFYTRRAADQDLSVIYFRNGLEGQQEVLLDPHTMSSDHTVSVGLRDISEDGKRVVYAVREGGVDEVTLRIMEVDSRKDLPDQLSAARYGSIALTPDNQKLYYSRYGADHPAIFVHTLGEPTSRDKEVFVAGKDKELIPSGTLSDDGKWMLIQVSKGSSGPTRLYLKNLQTEEDVVTLQDDGISRSSATFAGPHLLITTDLEAPNNRLFIADPAAPAFENWKEIIPHSEDRVIVSADGRGGQIMLTYLSNIQRKLALYDMEGKKLREIEFDTIGSVGGTTGSWEEKEVFFSYSSFHVPNTVYRYELGEAEKQVWAQTEVPLNASDIKVEQVRYASKDGTQVPMFVVHRRDLELDGDNPTLLTGYGGFNVSRSPGFSASGAIWVERGGVYAVANLRGGGEFGEQWHRAGMLENKQNVFDDFIAAAEYLISEKYTRPARLAIQGGSNGGLLVGAAMTQRPDLFGAVVCTYPLLDMLRYQNFLVASFWVPEYGSSEDPEQFKYLKAYSPYHNVREGVEYPPVLFLSGDGDTRVAPLHARKMAALMQARSAGPGPTLLRYHTKAGHSGGQPTSEQIDQLVDVMSFLELTVGE